MNRWKAFATHLLLSVAVVGGIALAAFLLWYPDGLHHVAGLDRLLLVMLGIDLTAGPLLTLLVYKPGKAGLRFDLSVIALAQMAFLAFGLHTLRQSRPVFVVGTPETFTVVFANEVDPGDLANAPRPEWRRLSWTGPQLVGARMPDDPEQRRRVMEAFMAGGAGIERNPRYYLPYEQVAPDVLATGSQPLDSKVIPHHLVDATGRRPAQLRAVPVASKRASGTMLVDATSGEPLRAVAAELP